MTKTKSAFDERSNTAFAYTPLKSYYKLQDGKIAGCEFQDAQIVCYNQPGRNEQQEMLQLYNIDYHTLQSSLDPDELSRLEFESDHAAIIFKRPKSYCAHDNFLLKVTSTGVFLHRDKLIVVMPDDAPLFEGKVPFAIQTLQDVLLRLFYQSIMHFEGHLQAINMLSDSIEKRLMISMENRYLLNMFTLEKSLVYILNSLNSNTTLYEKIKSSAFKIGFSTEQMEILDDIMIENQQCFRRSEIYAQVVAGLMDARASLVSNNQNQLIKKLTIIMLAIMLPTLIISIFSMNVELPFAHEGRMAFWVISLSALLPSILVLWLWRRKGW